MATPRGCTGIGGGFSNGFSNGFEVAVIVCPAFCPDVGDIVTGLQQATIADVYLSADIAELIEELDNACQVKEGDADSIGVEVAEVGELIKQGQITRETI